MPRQQRNQLSLLSQGTLLALAVGIGIAILPKPKGLSVQVHRFLALSIDVVMLWVTEALPIGATDLLAGRALKLFKIYGHAKEWEPFANTAVMFVLMSMMSGFLLKGKLPQRLQKH